MKNKINPKLKEWVREVHGRRTALAQHCGISGGTVDSWLHERCGIAKRHHAKIFEITGGTLPTEIRYIETSALKKMWFFCVENCISHLHYDAFFFELSRRAAW